MPKFNDCQCINCQYTKVHDVDQLNKTWCEFKLQIKLLVKSYIARIKKWWRK